MPQCGLKELPEKICWYVNLRRLDLENNLLDSIPACFEQLKNLEILLLPSNEFTVVPKVLGRLKKLRILSLENNTISELAGNALAPSLKSLILTRNWLHELPRDLCIRAPRLKKLLLSHNDLEAADLEWCLELELVRLAGNRLRLADFHKIGANMHTLAWLSLNGNYGSALADTKILEVEYEDLVLEKKLEESPSRISWLGKWNERPVEIKLFQKISNCHVGMRSRQTVCGSDGTPRTEFDISTLVGTHSNYTRKTLAVLQPPWMGLILEVLPDSFENRILANHPSSETLTRDIYQKTYRHINAKIVANILLSVAKAMLFLHGNNIAHGDLRAHNIYYSKKGDALLSYFGASYSYDPSLKSFELIEVRAFGILMGELLKRVPPWQKSHIRHLLELQEKTQIKPHEKGKRPSFAELVFRINQIWNLL